MAKTKLQLRSMEDVDKALLELGVASAEVQREEAKLNEEIQKLRASYDERTKNSQALIKAKEAEIEEYCLLNKTLFNDKRTIELTHGTVAMRTNPPKVSVLNKKYTLDLAVELLEKLGLKKFVRAKKEVDKEAILSDYATKDITDEKLANVGLRIDQAEKFGYEIKWETIAVS